MSKGETKFCVKNGDLRKHGKLLNGNVHIATELFCDDAEAFTNVLDNAVKACVAAQRDVTTKRRNSSKKTAQKTFRTYCEG